jgi:hypothetical protein
VALSALVTLGGPVLGASIKLIILQSPDKTPTLGASSPNERASIVRDGHCRL